MNRSDNLTVTAVIGVFIFIITGCVSYAVRNIPFAFALTLAIGIGAAISIGWNGGRYYSK